MSPRLMQCSQGQERLHLSLHSVSLDIVDRLVAYFRCRHGAHDRGTLFRFRMTLKLASGDLLEWDDAADGGTEVILPIQPAS